MIEIYKPKPQILKTIIASILYLFLSVLIVIAVYITFRSILVLSYKFINNTLSSQSTVQFKIVSFVIQMAYLVLFFVLSLKVGKTLDKLATKIMRHLKLEYLKVFQIFMIITGFLLFYIYLYIEIFVNYISKVSVIYEFIGLPAFTNVDDVLLYNFFIYWRELDFGDMELYTFFFTLLINFFTLIVFTTRKAKIDNSLMIIHGEVYKPKYFFIASSERSREMLVLLSQSNRMHMHDPRLERLVYVDEMYVKDDHLHIKESLSSYFDNVMYDLYVVFFVYEQSKGKYYYSISPFKMLEYDAKSFDNSLLIKDVYTYSTLYCSNNNLHDYAVQLTKQYESKYKNLF